MCTPASLQSSFSEPRSVPNEDHIKVLSCLSGETPDVLQLFTKIHQSEQFTEAAAFKFFAGITRSK